MANDSCATVEDDPRFIPIAAIRAAVGTVSAIACVILVVLIIWFKKYKHSLTQRLILYLAVAAFFHSLSYPLARVNYYTPRELISPYCYFGGFFNLYTSWIEVLALTCLTLGSFVHGVLKRVQPRWVNYVYLSLPYILPLLWCWIPFINHSFGSGNAWCDIRTINPDCSTFLFGAVLRFAIWYLPLAIILFVLFVFSLVVLFRVRRVLRSEGTVTMEQWEKDDLNEVKYLVLFPIVYLVLNIFSFINRLDIAIQGEQSLIPLYYFHIFTSPFRGAVIALVFTFDPDTRKRLANPKMLCAGGEVKEYAMEHSRAKMSFSTGQ